MTAKHALFPALVCAVVSAQLGCASGVLLGDQAYPPVPDSVEVTLIDAMAMTRAELEEVLADHQILARFSVFVSEGEDFEEKLARQLEKAKPKARAFGGDALMYTHDSQLVAAIVRDARYAGPSDEIVLYAMRRRSER